MTNLDEYLNILAGIMRTEKEENSKCRSESNKLYTLIHKDLESVLDDSMFPNSPEIINKLDDLQNDVENLASLPDIIGKKCVLFKSIFTNSLFYFLKNNVFDDDTVFELSKIKSKVPFVILDSDSFKLEVVNYAGNHSTLFLDDYRSLMLESYKEHIAVNKLIKYFIVYIPMKIKNTVMIFDNHYGICDKIFKRAISLRIQFLDFNEINDLRKPLNENINGICVIKKNEQLIKSNGFLNSLNLISQSDVLNYMVQNSMPVYYGFKEQYSNICSYISEYFLREIDSSNKIIDLIIDDLVHSENSNEYLKTIKNENGEFLLRLKEQFSKVELQIKKLEICVFAISELFDDRYTDEKFVPNSVFDFLFERFFRLIGKDNGIFKEIYSRLITLHYPHCEEIYNFMDIYSNKKKENISVSAVERWEIAKAWIILADLDKDSYEIMRQCIAVLSQNGHFDTGKEYFAKAKLSQNVDLWLTRSLEKGYLPASDKLFELYKLGYGRINLRTLSNNMNPEACMEIAESYNDDFGSLHSLTSNKFAYIKIAAAKGHIPAICYLADTIYEKYFQNCVQIYGDQFSDPKFQNRIKKGYSLLDLCNYLIKLHIKPTHYSEVLGVTMFCLNQNHLEVMKLLGGIETKEANYCKGVMYEFGNGVAKDLSQAIIHYEKANKLSYSAQTQKALDRCTHKHIKNMEIEEDDQVYDSTKNYSSYTSNHHYYKRSICFITTATCLSLNKGDQCDELMLLRKYRDEYLLNSIEGEIELREYYRTAPIIISKINKSINPKRIYLHLWNDYISLCCKAIEENEYEKARCIYKKMMIDLSKYYSVDLF